VTRLLTVIVLFSAVPAFSQGFEMTALIGYTTPGGLTHDYRTVDDLKLAGSSTWGASAGYFFSPRIGVSERRGKGSMTQGEVRAWLQQAASPSMGTKQRPRSPTD